MFFSILLPSKNGEKYIENCILSILDQSFTDYELIIGNNANNKSFISIINKYSKTFNNLKVINHHEAIPVHLNWQSCLNAANGKYIIMLGDDDCLLPNSLSKIYEEISSKNFPEAITFNGISYYEKGSINNSKHPFYKKNFFNFKMNNVDEGFLNYKKRLNIVKQMFYFDNMLPLNMQTHIFSLSLIKRIKKPIYQPPFPDHYALNASLLVANNWYVSYKKIIAVGISNKSFGHYFYSSQNLKGIDYLGLKFEFKDEISGSILNTCQMIWLEKIKKDYSNQLEKVNLRFADYLARQLYFNIKCLINKKISLKIFLNFIFKLKFKHILMIPLILFNLKYVYLLIVSKSKKDKLNKILDRKNNIYDFTRSYY